MHASVGGVVCRGVPGMNNVITGAVPALCGNTPYTAVLCCSAVLPAVQGAVFPCAVFCGASCAVLCCAVLACLRLVALCGAPLPLLRWLVPCVAACCFWVFVAPDCYGQPCFPAPLRSVQDDGIGMSKDVQKVLFQAFTQAKAKIARQYGGTGLGLSITQKLVLLMGGSVEIESAQGSGSCFLVKIPFLLGDAEEAQVWGETKGERSRGR